MAAKRKPAKPSDLRTLHPLESLGVVSVGRGSIRAERLEHRLAPKVPFPHKHDFYHLLLITQGGGSHEIDFAPHRADSRVTFLMKPGQVHSWQLERGTRGYVIEFTDESLPAGLLANWVKSAPDQLPANKKIRPFAEKLVQEFKSSLPLKEVGLQLGLQELLLALARSEPLSVPTPTDSALSRLVSAIEADFRREHGVEHYAAKLGTSPKALTMKILRAGGKSVRALIQERLVLEAKRLLAHSPYSVAEVGYELGFEDPNYFARFFGQHAGMAPGAFRLAARKAH